jgi:hypothetical protein
MHIAVLCKSHLPLDNLISNLFKKSRQKTNPFGFLILRSLNIELHVLTVSFQPANHKCPHFNCRFYITTIFFYFIPDFQSYARWFHCRLKRNGLNDLQNHRGKWHPIDLHCLLATLFRAYTFFDP